MTTLAQETGIFAKTKELCEAIINDDTFRKLQADVERFLSDEAAKLQYRDVHQKGEELHHKQHAGVELSSAEIKAFEDTRESLFRNKIATDFMDAQRSMEEIQKQIAQFINLTFELGHLPSDEEFAEAQHHGGGCCGGGGGGGCCGG